MGLWSGGRDVEHRSVHRKQGLRNSRAASGKLAFPEERCARTWKGAVRERSVKARYAETHYLLSEIAEMWRVSPSALKPMLLKEPGVLVLQSRTLQLSIPESVAERVYRRLTERPEETPTLDVFLAYNSKDKSAIEKIARRLRRRGLKPWFDKWHLPPGRVFQDEIGRVLPVAKSIAIFVGAHGLGDFERMELRVAIDEFVRRKAPVIPVLLPGSNAANLPIFLKPFSQVRFKSLSDSDALHKLICGIEANRDGHSYVSS